MTKNKFRVFLNPKQPIFFEVHSYRFIIEELNAEVIFRHYLNCIFPD